MEKKDSEKLLTRLLTDEHWRESFKDAQCPIGCDISKAPCKHFEDYFSMHERTNSVVATPVGLTIEAHSRRRPRSVTSSEFKAALKRHKLDAVEADIITRLFWLKESPDQIGTKLMLHANTVRNIKNKALTKLRSANFSFNEELDE